MSSLINRINVEIANWQTFLGYPGRLVRIGMFALFFWWLFSKNFDPLVKPGDLQESCDPEKVLFPCYEPTSPQAFISPIPQKQENEFRLAWIGASPLVIPSSKNKSGWASIIGEVQQYLENQQHCETRMLAYVINSGMLFDLHQCLLHALKQNPDLIVISLNPLVAFFNFGFSNYQNMNAEVLPLTFTKGNNPWLHALTITPLSIWKGILEDYAPGLRYCYGRLYEQISARLPRPKAVAEQKSTLAVDSYYKFFVRLDRTKFAFVKETRDYQRNCLYHSNPKAGINQTIVSKMMSVLTASGKPALIYTDPVNPAELAHPEVLAEINAVDHALTVCPRGKNISLWTPNPHHGLPEQDYRDMIHLATPAHWVPLIGQRLYTLITSINSKKENTHE